MTTIGAGPAQSLPTYTPYSPLGKPTVGLESPDTKTAPVPPIEQAGPDAKSENRTQERSAESTAAEAKQQAAGKAGAAIAAALTEAEAHEVRELAARDREVRAHEAAHAAVGGALAGAASFRYVKGPDGVRYAVAGEVSIAFGESSDPEATLRNAEQVRAAALAPANPSAQDVQVAAAAAQIALQAQLEIAQQRIAQSQQQQGARTGQVGSTEKAGGAEQKTGSVAANSPTSRRAAAYGETAPEPGSLLDQRA